MLFNRAVVLALVGAASAVAIPNQADDVSRRGAADADAEVLYNVRYILKKSAEAPQSDAELLYNVRYILKKSEEASQSDAELLYNVRYILKKSEENAAKREETNY